jgi:hypothetical protein
MRRAPRSPLVEPRRSESAIILALTLAAVLLLCAVVILDAAGPAKAYAEGILRKNDDFGVNYLPDLEAAVALRFVYPAILCLFLAGVLVALAFASRSGPRWSVIALGLLCGLGVLALLYVTLVRLAVGLPGGGYAMGELMTWLKDAAPPWFAPTEGIPTLAAVFGLPAVGILLIHRHLRNAEAAGRSVHPDAVKPFG